MATARIKIFSDGESEVVAIPQAMSFGEGVELTLERNGDVLTLRPVRPTGSTGADLAARLRALPSPGPSDLQDDEPLPERPGL